MEYQEFVAETTDEIGYGRADEDRRDPFVDRGLSLVQRLMRPASRRGLRNGLATCSALNDAKLTTQVPSSWIRYAESGASNASVDH